MKKTKPWIATLILTLLVLAPTVLAQPRAAVVEDFDAAAPTAPAMACSEPGDCDRQDTDVVQLEVEPPPKCGAGPPPGREVGPACGSTQ